MSETVIKLKIGDEIQIGDFYFKVVPLKEGETMIAQVPKRFKRTFVPCLLFLSLLLVPLLGLLLLRDGDHKRPIETKEVGKPPPFAALHARSRSSPPRQTIVGVKVQELKEQAEAAFSEGRFQEAYPLWVEVLSHDPANRAAQEGLGKLEEIASRLYEEAMMIRSTSPDRAHQKMRLALNITGPKSPVHQQMAGLLKEGT